MAQNFVESKDFWRPASAQSTKTQWGGFIPEAEVNLLKFVLENSEKGNPEDVIAKIDQFCSKTWMMNVGPEKGKITKHVIKNNPIKKILQIGGYCGYSALVFANEIKGKEGAKVFSLEVKEEFINIARQIHEHAGLGHMIDIHLGTVGESQEYIKAHGSFDMVFIDHFKEFYLSDFRLLEKYGVISQGNVIVADNMFFPGAPDYLQALKASDSYVSTLYHAYVEYMDIPDAVLVSVRK